MAEQPEPADGAGLRRGLAVPCFGDEPGQLGAALPDYAAAGATWFIESPTSRPGWLEAVRDRIRRGPEVQSGRG